MTTVDFTTPAEIFSKSKKSGWLRSSIKYRRFDNLSLAVKFAMEECRDDLNYVSIHTESAEYTGYAIRSLYENEQFPLLKHAIAPDTGSNPPTPSTRTSMSSHKFKIGDTVIYIHPGLKGRDGMYEVIRILPTENAEPAYRIKSKTEQHERAVKEHEISAG
jgi:hypothetical protein